MTTVCPICNSPVEELDRTGDATGFHCATHGKFKVADTIFPEDYTRQQCEVALDKARERTEPDEEEDEWPLIITDDFR